MRKVVRIGAPNSVYVGRPSILGNPYVVGRDGSRAEVIEKYRAWFQRQLTKRWFIESVRLLCGDKDLACWCAPKACHADVILEWLNAS